ncbi:hypothetical protein RM190_12095 [Paracoccus sp. CPCC 101403]|uniref:Secreted protein n=2 Tax=Paracoccus broussonetiae TaxID=3075834 RepID=A0ABU3EEE9_9RHOB|nr:hypothetical protein [Paracoccus sp. CPCC 101403]MDT1062610.1 hypothetical protein [Paracoccus sp. CPCC 101403]
MRIRNFATVVAVAASLSPIIAGASFAAEQQNGRQVPAATQPQAIHVVKTTDAMLLKTVGRATDMRGVYAQGGFAVPGAVRWVAAPQTPVVTQAAMN